MNQEMAGDNFILRRTTLSHALQIYEVVESNMQRLIQTLPFFEKVKTLEEVQRYLLLLEEEWDDKKSFEYGIWSFEGKYLGGIHAYDIDWKRLKVELGFWISANSIGKGYVSNAIHLLERELLTLGFRRFEIRTTPENKNAIRVAERCGYKIEDSPSDLKTLLYVKQ